MNTDTFTEVQCLTCGHTMPPDLLRRSCGACGSVWLDARYDYDRVAQLWPDALANRPTSLWRYAELLPVDPAYAVSIYEGWSPLVAAGRRGAELGLNNLYIKDERQSPTSSFKDRQASMAVSALVSRGVTECVMASTGNAAAAYAAYCARAGIKLWVFTTSLVPAEKMRETALYGAEVVKVTGTYDQAKAVAANYAQRHNLHAESGAKGVVGKESMKTMAYEIAEWLGWKAHDWNVQAVSGGIGPIGARKGSTELAQMGLIDRLPKLAIIQVDGCSPMVQAFRAGSPTAEPVTPRTNITVLSTGDPGYGYTYLYEAVQKAGGTMTSVSDEAAFRVLRTLARTEGISVEPATAVAFAGLQQLAAQGIIGSDETVVVNASGHTLPVEKFILSDQHFVDIAVSSPLADTWGMPEEGLLAALDQIDEKVTSIVVIDDSVRDSRLIRRLLQRYKDYRVFEANSAEEGLALIRDRRPDRVTVDLLMPDMDGFAVLDALKSDPELANIPVIVVSGKTLTQEERRILEERAVSTWVKGDYSTRDLVDHIVTQVGDAELIATERTIEVERSVKPSSNKQFTILVIDDNPG
ncbi:MAG: pyridoxal-phosphate dependent enzyme, partial [Anaerolineae bacterium]